MNNPILQFDFLTNKNASKPLIFTQPEHIITASNLKEIAGCLQKVEQAVKSGYYVAGYISYEAAYAFYDELNINLNNKMPLIWFGVFRNPSLQTIDKTGGFTVTDWKLDQTKNEYDKHFQMIMNAIENKVTEQVNYTVQFHANFTGNPYVYYEQLKHAQRAKYSAYLDIGNFQLLSASPELFFQVQNGLITVKPMKGTIHRGKTYEEDVKNRQWLQTSDKNKRENLLITQLMKDELKKVANEAAIEVTKQYEIEKYPTVYQMTSTITGKVFSKISTIDIIQALFPCGSISGVPKFDTLKLIANLEAYPREVYCGAIGYITPQNEAIFNVPIRTVMIDKQTNIARYGAGGAITRSSNKEEEYREILTKTKVLHWKPKPFHLLETFGLYDGEYIVFEEHIKRLRKSADYFAYDVNISSIKEKLLQNAKNYQRGAWRVRLLIDEAGQEKIEVFELHQTSNVNVRLAKTPIDKENKFLYHKTTNRTFYEEHMQDDVFDVLLWNEDDEITEFTIGNIVVELNGELLTPPVESGLLPGTFREKLLQDKKIKERKIYKSDLKQCSKIWLINSVRKWVKVNIQ